MTARSDMVRHVTDTDQQVVQFLRGVMKGTDPTVESKVQEFISSSMDPWNEVVFQRETLNTEIRRAKECLADVQNEINEIHGKLEEWPAFERICGQNPIVDYMTRLAALERTYKFLPGWINRRERQLKVITEGLHNLEKR